MGLKLSSQSRNSNLSNGALQSTPTATTTNQDFSERNSRLPSSRSQQSQIMGNVVNFGSTQGQQQQSQQTHHHHPGHHHPHHHRHSVVGTGDGLHLSGAGGPSTSNNSSGGHHHGSRMRARSLGAFGSQGIGIPPHLVGGARGASGSPDSDSSSPDDSVFTNRFMQAHSLPVHLLSALQGIKCPVCSKFVPPDDIECHLVICLTKPRITYNEDVLKEDKGDECVICLEELLQGDTIARLPCLCIYHKCCIDSWFERNRSCPEHPS
ncbi:E3 ubiquitin-protein ligase znrf2-like isoform X2 [Tubulanus polymorphus]|uniref:E3 ubiquitin-protein ligase znrf2-like isoform X2 n=1 Tax=Tubulanus polymorphus TaxID=672921 RepID=UPI003DA5A9BB